MSGSRLGRRSTRWGIVIHGAVSKTDADAVDPRRGRAGGMSSLQPLSHRSTSAACHRIVSKNVAGGWLKPDQFD